MIDRERARATVLARGTAQQVASVTALLDGAPVPDDVRRELEEAQHEDGGFPHRRGGPSSVRGTCYALAAMRALPPLGGSPMATRALSFVRRTQEPDGSWAEGEAATAEACFTLALMAPEQPQPAELAARWLGARPLPPAAAVTAACGLWVLHARGLAPAPPPPDLPAGGPELARAVLCCVEAEAGGAWHLTVAGSLLQLAGQEESDPETALLALRASLMSRYR
jgi:hypothetical protein